MSSVKASSTTKHGQEKPKDPTALQHHQSVPEQQERLEEYAIANSGLSSSPETPSRLDGSFTCKKRSTARQSISRLHDAAGTSKRRPRESNAKFVPPLQPKNLARLFLWATMLKEGIGETLIRNQNKKWRNTLKHERRAGFRTEVNPVCGSTRNVGECRPHAWKARRAGLRATGAARSVPRRHSEDPPGSEGHFQWHAARPERRNVFLLCPSHCASERKSALRVGRYFFRVFESVTQTQVQERQHPAASDVVFQSFYKKASPCTLCSNDLER